MTRYRRKQLSRGDAAAAAITSVLVGMGTAAVTFYVTRLLLSREPLAGSGASPEALPPGTEPETEDELVATRPSPAPPRPSPARTDSDESPPDPDRT